MNKVLEVVNKYLLVNKLKLNVDKTETMIITSKYKYGQLNVNDINLKLGYDKRDLITSAKYLGFYIDSHLNFNAHFEYICTKIGKKRYYFMRISINLSVKSIITVHQAIVQPHFDFYASILFLLNSNQKDQLQKLQNRCTRIIITCSWLAPISSMSKTLSWFSFEERCLFMKMSFVFILVNDLAPSYFDELLCFNIEVHNDLTREHHLNMSAICKNGPMSNRSRSDEMSTKPVVLALIMS
ncbi:hypothetical protein WA026_023449 [Henosepilachna vigintioctopunctata]|uniref:Reverse transcriptase domain-containing protein n=1 Tax=Henosepilachna vigintioctopunctata TaxID=420089 RepID=A0AAW1UPV3_9CUCU